MKNTVWKVLCLLLGFVLATYINSVIAADPQIAELQSQIATLQNEVTTLKATLADMQIALKKDISGMDFRLKKLESVVQVGSTVTIESAGSLALKSAGTVSVNGSLIRLNGGSTPVATIKSTVSGTKIMSGSSTVLVP